MDTLRNAVRNTAMILAAFAPFIYLVLAAR